MDNLTHTLVGLALSRAGFSRGVPHAATLAVLAANAPDVDIAALAGGSLRYFEWHRGWTHTLIGAPLLALLSILITVTIFRTRMPLLRAGLLAMAGVLSHLLLDWTNSYGIRWLMPWSYRWFRLDIVHLYDVVLLAVLAVAASLPWLERLMTGEIGRARNEQRSQGRMLARFALLFIVLYDGGRSILHGRAVQQLESRLYDGAAPLAVAALPDSLDPTRWTGVVEGAEARYRYLPARADDIFANEPQRYFKLPPDDPVLMAVQQDRNFVFLRYFSSFPAWTDTRWEPSGGNQAPGHRIELTDLRFGLPGEGAFHSIAFADERGRIIESAFYLRAPK